MFPLIRPTLDRQFPVLANGLHRVALGNGSEFELVLFRDALELPCKITLAIIGGKGCYSFGPQPHATYIAEKLGCGLSDAHNLSDLITCQFGQRPDRNLNHHYAERLCLAPPPPDPARPRDIIVHEQLRYQFPCPPEITTEEEAEAWFLDLEPAQRQGPSALSTHFDVLDREVILDTH